MKFIASLILTLFCSLSLAGPGDGPIVPWPTSIREDLVIEDIQGSWIGYSHNSIWNIDIYSAVGISDVGVIRIRSEALFTNKAQGLLNDSNGFFWGEVTMDLRHRAIVILYKDSEGTKLRLVNTTTQKFHDIKLYPSSTQKTQEPSND